MDAKRQRLKNQEEASMDTTENDLEKIRADVDLVEDKPPTTPGQSMVCNSGRQNSHKEFTRSPHPILKAQSEPEFEGEHSFFLSQNSNQPLIFGVFDFIYF